MLLLLPDSQRKRIQENYIFSNSCCLKYSSIATVFSTSLTPAKWQQCYCLTQMPALPGREARPVQKKSCTERTRVKQEHFLFSRRSHSTIHNRMLVTTVSLQVFYLHVQDQVNKSYSSRICINCFLRHLIAKIPFSSSFTDDATVHNCTLTS